MKKKIIISLIVILLLSISATFAYIMTSFKTNELTIKVGTQDVGNAILTDLQPGYVLIPNSAIVSQPNETKMLEYHLTVQNDETKQYTISYDLPDGFILTHNNSNAYFTTGTTYTITITLSEPVAVTNQTFYINIQLV
ncbi:MAG: hypothetical protein RBS07_15185 [Lentimicrobium sp.]|jgi:hypothetical protein|nr:hypothetical protein [Lentimicrobium sp.]